MYICFWIWLLHLSLLWQVSSLTLGSFVIALIVSLDEVLNFELEKFILLYG